MGYIGEHLLPGQLGHFFIILSLVASLVATFAYFKSTRSLVEADGPQWKKLARYAFITEVISVVAIFGILFYIIYNHLFEYKYAWQHSSRSLEFKYLLACFWEGQEGSFLLWSTWHCVLGLIVMRTSKKWEAPVMTVISAAQVCLATMLTGIYFFGWKMGSNPFILLRDSGVLDSANALHINGDAAMPLRPDYLLSIRDGNDLNPLLQNYWMVIHPPVLFLGFASTIVPFAFAVAGLWTKKFGEWIRHGLPWALFSAAVLGVGIMMGAMWAYESLTFGGYWAWDPVENASLVPWLVLIAGIHTMLIYKHSGHSLRSAHLFLILSFVLVLYSTFLTRSGVLGETSVHAFTDLGMNAQLFLLMYVFIWGAAVLTAKPGKQQMLTLGIALGLALICGLLPVPSIAFMSLLAGLTFLIVFIQMQVPTVTKEENAFSREFWMFIGSLVFFLSALVIIGKTSLEVVNKIFGTKFAAPEDAEFAYNGIQIYVAIIIALLTAITQYMRYKETTAPYFWKKIGIPTIIAAIIATLVLVYGDINYTKEGPGFLASIWLAVACSIYAVIANAAYLWLGIRGNLKLSGGSISHVGFGLVLIGILLSSSKKEILSNNINGIPAPLGEKEDPRENLTLVKGIPTKMGKYTLTYVKDSTHPKKQLWFYQVDFKSNDGKEEFSLLPNAFVNYKGNEGLMANPDSRHYWNHDVFTYITSLPDPDRKPDTTAFQPHSLKTGDSLFYSRGFIIVDSVHSQDSLPEHLFGKDGKLYGATLKIYSKTGSTFTITPKLAIAKGESIAVPDTVTSESLVLKLSKVNADNSIELGMKESNSILEYITLKAYKFPFINILWLGVIITAIGILISTVRRIQLNRKTTSSSEI